MIKDALAKLDELNKSNGYHVSYECLREILLALGKDEDVDGMVRIAHSKLGKELREQKWREDIERRLGELEEVVNRVIRPIPELGKEVAHEEKTT